MSKVPIVIGGDGLLGSHLCRKFSASGMKYLSTTRRGDRGGLFLDLSKDIDTFTIPDNVGIVFWCAGIASIARCATDLVSQIINSKNAIRLMAKFLEKNAYIVFLSSDLAAFSSEVYAEQKRQVERFLYSNQYFHILN